MHIVTPCSTSCSTTYSTTWSTAQDDPQHVSRCYLYRDNVKRVAKCKVQWNRLWNTPWNSMNNGLMHIVSPCSTTSSTAHDDPQHVSHCFLPRDNVQHQLNVKQRVAKCKLQWSRLWNTPWNSMNNGLMHIVSPCSTTSSTAHDDPQHVSHCFLPRDNVQHQLN